MSARLLLVEDDDDLARGLAFNFRREGHEVALARDLAEAARAVANAAAAPFDVIVLDLTLPDGDGLALLRRWRAGGLATAVLCLTARSQEADVVAGLKLGADDYVTKPFGLAALLARVEALLRRARSGSGAEPPSAAVPPLALGPVQVDLANHRVTRPDGAAELTPIETDLLRFFLARRGRVVERAELLKQLWGVERRHETRTLDNHVARLRKKIEPDPAVPHFLTTVHGIGYRFEQ